MLQQKNGLHFRGLCIDPHKSPKEEKVLFTHAHSDHIKLSKNPEFFATLPTIDLIEKRFPRKYDSNFTTLAYNKKYQLNDFQVELKENGHILGSVQTKISHEEKDYLITSDFRLQDSLLFKGAKPEKCDTLVLETTFGSSQYAFPSYDSVLNEMVSFLEKNSDNLILLSGYSLGKAQELTAIANQAGLEPVVHDSIFEMNKIYEKHGISLGKYQKLDHNLKEHSVLIMPPQLVDKFLFATLKHVDKRQLISALATGWGHKRGFDVTFPLSNHADYNDLIAFVEQSQPKLVLTDHGFCEEFSRKLNRLGYNSKPLAQHQQQAIFEY